MPSQSILLHILSILIAYPIAVHCWKKANVLGDSAIIIRALLLYIMGAQLLKGTLLTLVDWQPALDTASIPRRLTEQESFQTGVIVLTYSLAVIAACLSVMLAIKASPLQSNQKIYSHETTLEERSALLYIIAPLLPFKYFINSVMRWGVPAVIPTNSIPLVTGVSVILIRDGLLCLCIASLYQNFVAPTRDGRKTRILSILATLVYVSIDLSVGSKFAMLGILFACMSLATRAFLRQGNAGKIQIILLSLATIAITLPIYQIANILRFIQLDNALDLIGIIQRTSEKVDLDIANIIFTVLGRATGAEGVAAAVILDGNLTLNALDIFLAGEFGSQYTFALSGNPAENNAFGATLSGTYTLLCRADTACIATFTYAITVVILSSLFLIIGRLTLAPSIQYGIATSLALVAVHAQLSSGGILAFGNRIFMIFVAGWSTNLILHHHLGQTDARAKA